MKLKYTFILTAFILLISTLSLSAEPSLAQTSQGLGKAIITRENGGSIQTRLGYNLSVNSESSLSREWITVHDPILPVDIIGTTGIKTIYEQDRISGNYKYTTKYTVDAKEPIAAIQVRFLIFDIWGNHIQTLVQTEVADIRGTKELSGTWNAYSANEVSEYYASIAFIARVRTQGGEFFKARVIDANLAPVLEEAKKFSKKFTVDDLEPKAEKK